MKSIASIATLPDRQEQLKNTVDSLLNQVDHIHIFLNGHDGLIEELREPPYKGKVFQTLCDNHLGDGAKFTPIFDPILRGEDDFYLTCDDDIIYPEGYVSYLMACSNAYDDKYVVTLGGKSMKPNAKSYHSDKSVNIHCNNTDLENDIPVQIPLTGVMAFKGSVLHGITELHFEHPNMADINVGIYCQKKHITCIAIARPTKWLKIQQVSTTIFNGGRGTGKENKQIQSNQWNYHGKI